MDLKAVGKSLGFESPPHIDIGVGFSKRNRPGKVASREGKKDHKAKIYRQPNSKGKSKNFSR